jgi:hypothetical protein
MFFRKVHEQKDPFLCWWEYSVTNTLKMLVNDSSVGLPKVDHGWVAARSVDVRLRRRRTT